MRESETGLRLDAFLARRNVFPSAAAARRALASGIVTINGRAAKKGAHLQVGDVVQLCDGAVANVVLVPEPRLQLDVLYEDSDIVAVDKPAGMASHPLHPGDSETVASALIARYPECTAASPDAREGGLGHRLDVGTSGVLLAARSRQAWHRLREALAAPSCQKIYLAEIRGDFPDGFPASDPRSEFVLPGPRPFCFLVSAPIGRQGRRRGKVKVAGGRQPLPARTEVMLVERRVGGAMVEARLARGRSHQVRAHLAYLGIPVRGDATYGEADPPSGLHLHAWAVSFLHPVTARPLRIEAPLPDWARPQGEV